LQVGVLERNKLTGSELLSRIQLLESRMDAAAALTGMAGDTGSAAAGANNGSSGSGGGSGCGAGSSSSSVGVSPFAQAKLMKQLQDVEQQVSGLLANSAQLGFRTEQVGALITAVVGFRLYIRKSRAVCDILLSLANRDGVHYTSDADRG
jgi:hypothetical protein